MKNRSNKKYFEVSLSKEEIEKICQFPKKSETLANEPYSNKFLIDKMFFYPKFFNLYVSIQHGVFIRKINNEIFEGDIMSNFDYALYDRPLKEQYGIKVLSVEHPFLFYRKKYNIKQKNSAKGTLIFPLHGSPGLDRKYSIKEYIKDLKSLPESFYPLMICLHFTDVLKGQHHIWYEEGFEVTSAGNGYREDFVKRFYDILTSVKYITSNESTSALFYAVDLKIPAFIYGDNKIDKVDIYSKFNQNNFKKEEFNKLFYKKYRLNDYFPTCPTTKISKKTEKFVDEVLGKNNPKNSRLYVSFVLYKEWIKHQIKKINILIEKKSLMKYKRFIDEKSLDIQNHMTLEEKLSLIKYSKNRVVAEVGSFLGSNTLNISNVAKRVYAVDNWKRHQIDNSFEVFKKNISNKKNIIILNGEFEEALRKVPNEIDIAIIDGEHNSYESVCRDIKILFPKIKVGGYIIIHHLIWSVHPKMCIYDYLKNVTKKINNLPNLWIGEKIKF